MNKEDFYKNQNDTKDQNDTESDDISDTESEEELDEFGNSINISSSENKNDIKSLISELPPPPIAMRSRAVFNSENDYGRGMRRKYNRRQSANLDKDIINLGLAEDHPNAIENSLCTKIDFKKQYDETFSRGYEFQKARSIRDKKIHQENLEKINKKSS